MIPQSIADILLLVVAISMLLTPALFILYERVIVPRYASRQEQEPDEIEEQGNIIIAGHGRFGGIVNRMLRGAGYSTTVLDYSASQLEMLRGFGFKVFYGDATRPDLLHAAGIDKAKLLVVALDNREQIDALVHHVRHHHPDVHIVARAITRQHVYDLYAAGVRDIIRETFDSSVRAGRSALEAMGVHPFEAELMARKFTEDDRHILRELAVLYDPEIPVHLNEPYVEKTKTLAAEREAQIFGKGERFEPVSTTDWRPPTPVDVTTIEEEDAEQKSSV